MSKVAAIGSRSDADEALERRYRAPVAADAASWNDTLDAILAHRSIRSYLPKALPDGTLELLVAAAQSAPSSSNLQAWSVVAVEDPERKARLGDLAGPNPQIGQAPLLLVWIADLSRLRAIAQDNDLDGAGLDYKESFLLAAIDAGLAAQNAVVAIDALGLGSCYIGAIRNRPLEVAEELGLPPEAVAVFGLTVGYPDPAVKADVKPRLAQSVVLHRERYDATDGLRGLADYDATLSSFQKEQGLPEAGWTKTVARRIGHVDALRGRDKLGDALKELGFRLR